jgi:hypothetical protein
MDRPGFADTWTEKGGCATGKISSEHSRDWNIPPIRPLFFSVYELVETGRNSRQDSPDRPGNEMSWVASYPLTAVLGVLLTFVPHGGPERNYPSLSSGTHSSYMINRFFTVT